METIVKTALTWGFTEFEINTVIKILLASICGGLIGLEREMKGRPAGLKTFSLVCLGATLVMVTNDYIFKYITNGTGDIVRMGAQVVSGIGFLGAGSIMVTGHNQVKGLTTAASLWVTAALGLAIGSGFYFGALAGVCVIYISSFIYRYIDRKIMERSRIMKMYVESNSEEFMLELVKYFNDNNIKVTSLQRKSENKWYADDTCATIELDLKRRVLHKNIITHIKSMDGVRYVEEI